MALAILLLTLVCSAETPRKRVSVMDFEFGTVQRWWDGNWDIGKGISDLLVDRLLSEGNFSVFERRKLDTVLAEQNFSTSERADHSSAARIGKMLGVNAIILGSVTQFGTEKKDFNASGVGGGKGGLGAGRMGTREGKASVAITARIIDINTGEVLASSTGRGQSSRSGLLLGGLVIGHGGFGAGSVSMNSSQFRETILGEATYAAVNDLSRQLNLFAHKVPSQLTGYSWFGGRCQWEQCGVERRSISRVGGRYNLECAAGGPNYQRPRNRETSAGNRF